MSCCRAILAVSAFRLPLVVTSLLRLSARSCDSAPSLGTSTTVFTAGSVVRRRARLLRPRATKTCAATGARDSASATTFVLPGRYCTSKSNSCSVKDQRCNFPVRLGLVISHFNAE
ncbi:hypothetical protein PF004_g30489 [Phytophthora fragariae]|uniref:Secreted protein n=1 Tax=Phytophthora fragariae TaxID=53985 RepID=A0A6A3GUH1_9STRA|nr:hypothetical protein PF011_g29993 [Phytophthora fragariae]KAE9162448.1 hypothetical protein PF004_g30489 [Phytophthora fragariae]